MDLDFTVSEFWFDREYSFGKKYNIGINLYAINDDKDDLFAFYISIDDQDNEDSSSSSAGCRNDMMTRMKK